MIRSLLGAILLGATACAPAASPPPARVATSTAVPVEPLTLSGAGIVRTEAFPLAAGNYTLDWTATATQAMTAGCSHAGFLTSADNSSPSQMLTAASPKPGETLNGRTNAYNVKAGRYYLNMTSGCQWSVTITPAP